MGKLCVPNIIKRVNMKVYNFLTRLNESRNVLWHESCKCNKGYMWSPSTCARECDMWCKPGQYLDCKKCVCKNKLICKVISECASLISETTMNNKTNIINDDTTKNIFIGLFLVLMVAGVTCFCVFAYFKWIKGKKLFER